MPYFTWAESNANEGEQRVFLICIPVRSCEVQRLTPALVRVTCTLISLDVLTFANVPQVIEMVNYRFPKFLAFFWAFHSHSL